MTWIVLYPVITAPYVWRIFVATELRMGTYLRSMLPALKASVVMIVIVLGVRAVMPDSWPLVVRFAISVLAGALIGVIANLYMTLRGLRPANTARSALGRLYFGQMVKMVVSVVLLYVAATELPLVVREPRQVVVPPLLIGFIATLAVVWLMPFASAARLRRREQEPGSGTD